MGCCQDTCKSNDELFTHIKDYVPTSPLQESPKFKELEPSPDSFSHSPKETPKFGKQFVFETPPSVKQNTCKNKAPVTKVLSYESPLKPSIS